MLLHFGKNLREARRRYRNFVKNGIDQGTRPELQGGGLVRSAGGKKAGLLGRKKKKRPARLSLQRWRAGKRAMREFWVAEIL